MFSMLIESVPGPLMVRSMLKKCVHYLYVVDLGKVQQSDPCFISASDAMCSDVRFIICSILTDVAIKVTVHYSFILIFHIVYEILKLSEELLFLFSCASLLWCIYLYNAHAIT